MNRFNASSGLAILSHIATVVLNFSGSKRWIYCLLSFHTAPINQFSHSRWVNMSLGDYQPFMLEKGPTLSSPLHVMEAPYLPHIAVIVKN